MRADDLSSSHDARYGGVFINGAFDGEAFYVVSNDPAHGGAALHRLDAMTGVTTWMHAFTESTWGAQSLANGVLFVPSNSTLYVMNAASGDVLAQFETGATIADGSPAIAQGRVVVKSGFLYKDPVTKANDQIIAMRYRVIYQDIVFKFGCGSGQCHSAAAAGGLNMATRDAAYTNLVGVLAMGAAADGCGTSGMTRVVAGDPNRSLLVAKLAHTQTCGGPMPNAGTMLAGDQLQRIRDWISTGAPND